MDVYNLIVHSDYFVGKWSKYIKNAINHSDEKQASVLVLLDMTSFMLLSFLMTYTRIPAR